MAHRQAKKSNRTREELLARKRLRQHRWAVKNKAEHQAWADKIDEQWRAVARRLHKEEHRDIPRQ